MKFFIYSDIYLKFANPDQIILLFADNQFHHTIFDFTKIIGELKSITNNIFEILNLIINSLNNKLILNCIMLILQKIK